MAASTDKPALTLYGYFRSSCSARLRIALLIKKIDFEYIPVNIKDGLHLNDDYVKVNPSRSVPTLFVPGRATPITQSGAGLEYFEEAYPDAPALLPKDSFSRAQVRTLVNIITNDVQPVTNMKITKKVAQLGDDGARWSKQYHEEGFEAFEAIVKDTAGEYCFGDEITLADVCLAPAVWNAERWGVDLTAFPNLKRVYHNASKNEAFQAGHWKKQADCPEDLR